LTLNGQSGERSDGRRESDPSLLSQMRLSVQKNAERREDGRGGSEGVLAKMANGKENDSLYWGGGVYGTFGKEKSVKARKRHGLRLRLRRPVLQREKARVWEETWSFTGSPRRENCLRLFFPEGSLQRLLEEGKRADKRAGKSVEKDH